MIAWLLAKFDAFYEGAYTPKWLRPYRANPCDVGATPVLRPLGRALALLGSHCKCCSGARVLATAVLALAFPRVVAMAIVLWVVVFWWLAIKAGFSTAEGEQ